MEHPLLSRLRASRPDRRRTIAAVTAVVAAAAGGVVALTLGSASAGDGGTVDAGVGRCTTGADGTCVIEHRLGRAPDAVVVTLSAPVSDADALPYQLATDQYTEQSFRLRARTTTGSLYQGDVTVNYVAAVSSGAAPGGDGGSPSPTGPAVPVPSTLVPTSAVASPAVTATRTAAAGRPPGLSGAGVEDPHAFGAWRGKPVEVWETWNNFTSWDAMEALYSVREHFLNPRFTGKMSFSQPMWALGENAATCNSGRSDARMRAVFTNLKQVWGGEAYVRLGWEMNGDWFPQNDALADPAGWVTCWRRWYGIIKGVSSGYKLVWNPNFDSKGGLDVRTVWPGDEFVDVAGPDIYDWGHAPNATDQHGAPIGIDAWVAFVASHGKPFASPEWGQQGKDNAEFIQQLHNGFERARASATGLEYESVFVLEGCKFALNSGCNPSAAARYQQLF
ncbi:hypothetical protein KZZ52_27775 [Dactylosporangium sp. AC04546]|uniref:hypothetical protein n=1 Tax=Dactylosporangium sp. AC04546 TaxID=2862460 RepID=UPI001EE103BD|nr:hypothetical protein [Dactylosporangium sp. AC04546]WVK89066.1 hypothetical protein KZZ52_27775 [Dactylosporangium sp. AC04546]